jgi:hypothetical protein
MATRNFPSGDLGFGLSAFALVKDTLIDAGLIQFRGGYKYVGPGFAGEFSRFGGDVAFFRLARPLISRLGELCGPQAREHWSYGRPIVKEGEQLLVLRRQKVRRDDTPQDLPFDVEEPEVAEILASLEQTNSFLRERVDGIAFAGLRRTYNDGDVPGKRWRRGGRYYSLKGGEAYETMGGDARLNTIRLDGLAVAEVDMKASQLTVLHGILHLPFSGEGDPYDVGGIHREAVKAFINTSFGSGSTQWWRWSSGSIETYASVRPGHELAKDYSVAEVRRAVLARYPFLHDLGAEDGYNSLDLAWHEAEILTHAMRLLREQGVASLPVHDSLLVPWNKTEQAKAALVQAYLLHFEADLVIPRLTVSLPKVIEAALSI